jgi:Tol biopolymer transport system component
VRQRASADTDLEIIAPEWDGADPSAVPIPTDKSVVWKVAAIAVVGLVAAGVAGSLLHGEHKSRPAAALPATVPTFRQPHIDPDPPVAFTTHLEPVKGQGLIAVVSDGHLRVLDGDNQVMREADRPNASHPMWSPSGRWLAYAVDDTQIWVTNADITDDHQVGLVGVVRPDTVAWSPKTDTLAMITSAGLQLTPPDGTLPTPPLQHTAGASSVSWSPDGTRIAYTAPQAGGVGLVVLYESTAGEQSIGPLPVADEDLRLAAWWPDGRGVLAWKVPRAPSAAADGADLVSISLSGKETRLTTMLPYRQWLSWSPDGRHVVVVEGGGREAFTGKHLAVCDVVAGTCRSIGSLPGTVAVDPAWSPDGTHIDYVQADDDPAAGFGDWLGTRQLWTMRPDGSNAKRLGALDGVDAPRWLADSKRLFSVGGENALWLVDTTFVGPIASPLYQGEFPPGYYYGFVDWSQTLAWHQG